MTAKRLSQMKRMTKLTLTLTCSTNGRNRSLNKRRARVPLKRLSKQRTKTMMKTKRRKCQALITQTNS